MKKIKCNNHCGKDLEVEDNIFVVFCNDCWMKNKRKIGEIDGK